MNCPQAQQDIQLDLDGELTPSGKRALQQHLAHCAACNEIMRQHATIRGAMARLAALPPPAGKLTERPKPVYSRRWPWRVVAAIAAALVLCVAGWWAATALRREPPGKTTIVRLPEGSEVAPVGNNAVPPTPPVPPLPPQPDPRSLVHVEFDASSDVIAVPKPTRNPNITVLWIYPAIRTAEAKPAPAIEPDPADVQGAHS